MKNIHVLPTDKPSRLGQVHEKLSFFKDRTWDNTENWRCKNIYITNDEEIKEGDWIYRRKDGYETIQKATLPLNLTSVNKKIILTTDPDLIKDGVQPIDDEFLEWFVKNPSCEEIEVTSEIKAYDDQNRELDYAMEKGDYTKLTYKIIIPKEEPKQETLEEAAEIDLTNLCYYDKRNPDCSVDDEDIEDHKKRLLKKNKYCSCDNCFYGRTKLTEQLIRQAERMYSEEEVIEFGEMIAWNMVGKTITESFIRTVSKELFQQFKKK